MAQDVWWSASVWLVVFVRGEPVEEVDSVLLVRGPEADWDVAFHRALEAGRGLERTYLNEAREQVAWRLGGVRTIDQIEAEIADGREVFFTTRPVESQGMTMSDLRPDETRPKQTGV